MIRVCSQAIPESEIFPEGCHTFPHDSYHPAEDSPGNDLHINIDDDKLLTMDSQPAQQIKRGW